MASDALAKAREKKAEIISIHGTIKKLKPLEKAKTNPKSFTIGSKRQMLRVCGGRLGSRVEGQNKDLYYS